MSLLTRTSRSFIKAAPSIGVITAAALALSACSGTSPSLPSGSVSAPQTVGIAHTMSASAPTIQRPFSDFRNSQPGFWAPQSENGYYYFFLAQSGGASSVLPNCTSTAGNYAAGYMDYLGYENDQIIADKFPQLAPGTTETGTVTQSDNGDGTSTVKVNFTTKNAIATAACFNFTVFPSVATQEPLDFGYTISEIEGGSRPALGNSTFSFVFTIQGTDPAAPLPDLVFVPTCPAPAPCLQTIKFAGTASGALRLPFGVPDGTPGTLSMTQTGTNHTTGVAGHHGFPDAGLTAASVIVRQK